MRLRWVVMENVRVLGGSRWIVPLTSGEKRVGGDSSAMASGGDMMGLEDVESAAQPGTGAMEANGDGRGEEAEGEDLETNVERRKASWMDTVYS